MTFSPCIKCLTSSNPGKALFCLSRGTECIMGKAWQQEHKHHVSHCSYRHDTERSRKWGHYQTSRHNPSTTLSKLRLHPLKMLQPLNPPWAGDQILQHGSPWKILHSQNPRPRYSSHDICLTGAWHHVGFYAQLPPKLSLLIWEEKPETKWSLV